MNMQQCPNGHLYDADKNPTCPYCDGAASMNVTVPLGGGADMGMGAFPSTVPLDGGYVAPTPAVAGGAAAVTTPLDGGNDYFPATEAVGSAFGVTQYVTDIVNEKGIVEVRGWLVCLEGEKRGEDFKIRGEKTTIGRGSANDIKLDFDTTISKGVNATVTYDHKNNKFFIIPGESKNNIYVNENLLMIPVEIKDYDVIEIGETKMILRTLCNESFNWTKKAE